MTGRRVSSIERKFFVYHSSERRGIGILINGKHQLFSVAIVFQQFLNRAVPFVLDLGGRERKWIP